MNKINILLVFSAIVGLGGYSFTTGLFQNMNKINILLVLSGAIVALGGYCLNVKVPDGLAHPWKLKAMLGVMRFINLPLTFLEWFGYPVIPFMMSNKLANYLRVDPNSVDHENGLKISEEKIEGVRVIVHQPLQSDGLTPAVIYLHGGGWVVGSADMYMKFTKKMAEQLNTVIVSVDYRLAPEYPFPVPFEDCLKVAKAIMNDGEKRFKIDLKRVAISGDSAGGNLAAAVTLKLRDEGHTPKLKLQVLIYPVTQGFDVNSPSYQQNKYDGLLSAKTMNEFFLLYAQGHTKNLAAMMKNEHTSKEMKQILSKSDLNYDSLPKEMIKSEFTPLKTDFGNDKKWEELKDVMLNPYYNPLLAKDFSDLPKAYVYTAEQDVLRDQGVWYAQKLKRAGNDVTHVHAIKAMHGFVGFSDIAPEAKDDLQNIFNYIKKNL